jgi:hypothetical protein
MVKVLMIAQHITLCTSCIAFTLLSHTRIFAIDRAEQGHEKPLKPAPVEDANIEQE